MQAVPFLFPPPPVPCLTVYSVGFRFDIDSMRVVDPILDSFFVRRKRRWNAIDRGRLL